MPQAYDIILVGAGPAAYAALCALSGSGKTIAIVTGRVSESDACAFSKRRPHAKLASVNFESRRPVSLADYAQFPDGSALHASAEIGGFANYWGQQMQIYGRGDPWTGAQTWEDYSDLCHLVERDLYITGGEKLGRLGFGDTSLEIQTPRLLKGTATNITLGLGAMYTAINTIAERMPNLDLYESRVEALETLSTGLVHLTLQNGRTLRGSTIFLAAGVIGTANILQRSLSAIKYFRFKDHLPYMLYTVGLSKAVPQILGALPKHFNSLSLIRRHKSDSACSLFASVYRMSQAPISLVTASMGLGPRLRGRKTGSLADLVRPVQVWTPSTIGKYQSETRKRKVEVIVSPDSNFDDVLTEFCDTLKSLGVWYKMSSTPSGQGFHYHDLTLHMTDGSYGSIDRVLKDTFGEKVICLDASALPEIGCQPHTLTSLAQALARVKLHLA